MICQRCGADYTGVRCPLCGEPAPSNPPPSYCPQCGQPVQGSFCGHCGYCLHGHSPSFNPYTAQPTPPPTYVAANPYAMPPRVSAFTQRYQSTNPAQPSAPQKISPWMIATIVVYVFLCIILPILLVGMAVFGILYSDSPFYDDIRGSYYEEYDNRYNRFDPDDHKSSSHTIPDEETGEPLMPNGVSISEYKQLEVGMTYAEISYIIGGDAMGQDTDKAKGDEFIALWCGEYNTDAVITITFEDNIATKIEQDGLLPE